MRDLPTGTVTFLFSDIEGSTRLIDELGDSYAGLLAQYRRDLRQALAAHGGLEVDTQGDGYFAAFTRASDAVAAAERAQELFAEGLVRARIGLHTGEPVLTAEGYVGIDVHKAARIAAAGHGGQVLLSQATRELVDGDMRDLGWHRLKDLGMPEHLYQLGDREYPPLTTLSQTNLPVQLTPFLGRRRELSDLLALLRRTDVRLVTVTGPGGIGKTRLALQAAAESAGDFEHGVWWTPLAHVEDPSLAVDAVREAIGAPASLDRHIGDKHVLLVLDNFEHLVSAAPDLSPSRRMPAARRARHEPRASPPRR